jgi:hypothetical protein
MSKEIGNTTADMGSRKAPERAPADFFNTIGQFLTVS